MKKNYVHGYVHSSKPDMVEGSQKNTVTALIEGVRNAAIEAGLIEPAVFDDGVRGLYRTCETDGVFLLCVF